MKILKSLLYVVSADILSLFIALTLSGSSNFLTKLISAVCTSGILICLLASFAVKTASQDLKDERINNKKTSKAIIACTALTASLPSLISWLVLKFSDVDFYRWHKVINGFFLQIYNFINTSASSADLTSSQVNTMLSLVPIPALAFLLPYILTYKGVISSGN